MYCQLAAQFRVEEVAIGFIGVCVGIIYKSAIISGSIMTEPLPIPKFVNGDYAVNRLALFTSLLWSFSTEIRLRVRLG